ncbi:MAG: RluA family pseudouridine synthase [Proteobacteria bacterium]|nr:RluA family pseudouridine synthase [Pseudomonadota bacterium]MBU1059268.1 RluA family pseudouridine synthase [Pseudomonadota bacterium]
MSEHTIDKPLHCNLTAALAGSACQMLADASGLPKARIKIAMAKGAVWLRREGLKEQRIRKAKFMLHAGDRVQLFYDPKVLALTPIEPHCLAETEGYSVWFKPPWLLSQGTRYGDHCSLLRLAEKSRTHVDFKLVHRLDREASGLIVLAHNSKAARLLSQLFQENKITKNYFAEVWGNPQLPEEGKQLTASLDGKKACTEILTAYPGESKKSTILDILLHSGRLHQIRRHLADWGHPVLGDSQYGRNQRQENHSTLSLCAWRISFQSPFDNKEHCYQIPPQLCPSFVTSALTMKKMATGRS